MAESATGQLGASNPIPSVNALIQYGIMPTLDAQVRELGDACQDANLLVTSYGQLAGSFVAAQQDLPWVTVALSPVTVPSAFITTQPLPRHLPTGLQMAANRLQWGIGGLVLRQIADRPINRLRAQYQLKPLRQSLWLGAASRQLVCVACSPAFQPMPPDWPQFVRMTGFCFWDTPESWAPPPALSAFLQQERPYVVVTAGSIAPADYQAFASYFQTSVKAIHALGLRALVIGQMETSGLPNDEVLTLSFAPYSLVFPKAAAVIHHGGIGTTAQALRFGVPSLVVPWGVDQFYSASQLARIGAGNFIYWRRYTPIRAEARLATLLNDKRYKAEVGAIRSTISHENGAIVLCEAILSLFR
ncbi:MAG: glycosyltransferase [Ktedonobacterales bacterium]